MSRKSVVQSVLVGGAEGQLGQVALRVFAGRGLRVIGACRTAADRERTAETVAKAGLKDVRLLVADLSDERAVATLVADAESSGPVDGLFNAAGGFRYGATADATVADYDFLMNANLKSSFLLARALVKPMTARGFGRMVFVSSRATLGIGEANMPLYTASKAALNALVGALAREIRQTGVTVNAVMPTTIDTPANRQAMPKADFAEWVTPEALLDVVATLFGATGAPLNGALIPVAGRL